MEFYDDFLNDDEFSEIQNIVLEEIPWFWCTVLSDEDFNSKTDLKNNFQFYHSLYYNNTPDSRFYDKFYPIIKRLNIRSLIKMKLNLNPMTEEIVEHGMHVDNPYQDSKTAIFYLNTNNGYTRLLDGDDEVIVYSVENRIVSFDTQTRHTGSTCTDESRRIVLNINYF
tara:strand:+ start:74 stop:577 length:504 start_codon:yes stop_codon:yes gene_type:complete